MPNKLPNGGSQGPRKTETIQTQKQQKERETEKKDQWFLNLFTKPAGNTITWEFVEMHFQSLSTAPESEIL